VKGTSRMRATPAARHGIPAAHTTREEVEAGGPMSYGTDILDMSAGTKHNRQSSW
jgi:hypothetical protein